MPKTKKLIEKIKTNLFKEFPESSYQESRTKFIAEHQIYVPSTWRHIPGSFFKRGKLIVEDASYKLDQEQNKLEWNKKYPNGYKDWVKQFHIDGLDEQELIDKLNELIDVINKSLCQKK